MISLVIEECYFFLKSKIQPSGDEQVLEALLPQKMWGEISLGTLVSVLNYLFNTYLIRKLRKTFEDSECL